MSKLNKNSKKKLILTIACVLVIVVLGTFVIPFAVDLVLCSQLEKPIFADFLNELPHSDNRYEELYSGNGYYIVVSCFGRDIEWITFDVFDIFPLHFIT